MEWIVDNWYLLLAFLVVCGMSGCMFYHFIFEPRDIQIEKLKEWLKYAVTKAEKELGSGTGQLKLRYCYDLFVVRFPWLAKIVTFDQFDGYVKEALVWLNNQLGSNNKVKEYVK